jgi:hypothetical protein
VFGKEVIKKMNDDYSVPINLKMNLTIEEAAEYSNIGEHTLRDEIAKQILNIIKDGYQRENSNQQARQENNPVANGGQGGVREERGNLRVNSGGASQEGSSVERGGSAARGGEVVAEEEYDIYEVSEELQSLLVAP